MVWDDSTLYSDEDRGGACVPLSDIEVKARRRPHQLEVLRVNLTHDPASFNYSAHRRALSGGGDGGGSDGGGDGGDRDGVSNGGGAGGGLQISCLRMSERSRWKHVSVFGRLCAAPGDVADLPQDLPEHPWETLLRGIEEEEGEEGEGEGEEGLDGEEGDEGVEEEEEEGVQAGALAYGGSAAGQGRVAHKGQREAPNEGGVQGDDSAKSSCGSERVDGRCSAAS